MAFANPETSVELPGGATMDFVWIEPGTFMMGSPSAELGGVMAEGPQHDGQVCLGWRERVEPGQGGRVTMVESAAGRFEAGA